MTNKNTDLQKAMQRAAQKSSTLKTKVAPAVMQVIEPKPKRGRATTKDDTKTYIKLGPKIEESVVQDLKVALVTYLKDEFKTQEDVIQAALIEFLNNRKP
jgi:hypothetical protein